MFNCLWAGVTSLGLALQPKNTDFVTSLDTDVGVFNNGVTTSFDNDVQMVKKHWCTC